MNAHVKTVMIALCGMLLGLPAAQAADKFFHTTNLQIELDTAADGSFIAFPGDLTLKAGEHYRLELMNFSQEQQHVVIGPELEEAIILAGVRTYPQRDVIQGASLLKGISLLPGARVEIYFQPVKEGRYKLFCEDRGHTATGMDVAINVRR